MKPRNELDIVDEYSAQDLPPLTIEEMYEQLVVMSAELRRGRMVPQVALKAVEYATEQLRLVAEEEN